MTNEKTFKTSNGYKFEERDGELLVRDKHEIFYTNITEPLGDALCEFFQHKRDQELGRVRWPENPDYVIYRDTKYDGYGYGRRVRVLHEPSANIWTVWEQLPVKRHCVSVVAARWYFTEGPGKQERTWEQAQIGEVWWLTVDGEDSTYLVKGTGSGIPYFSGQKEYLVVNHARITAGRKLLNVDGSVTKGEQE